MWDYLLQSQVGEIRIQNLQGLGASYRMSGFFELKSEENMRVEFSGVAFGGHYGGHNVNIEISDEIKNKLQNLPELSSQEAIDELLSEVQRRILNGEMTVDFETIKNEEEQQNVDPFGNISA
jgi:hypothetical protein